MAIDGKLMMRARAELARMRREREAEADRRALEVYAKSPRVKEIDTQIRSVMADILGMALGIDKDAQPGDISGKIDALHDERRIELEKAGYSENYLDDEYMCAICRDTGYAGGRICNCLDKLYKAEQRASLSSLLKLGNETFESFDLSLYDDRPAPDTGVSPRQSMEIVYETCLQYARRFGDKSVNLFLNGAPGLGKTFLSACIARVVADKGHSVVYDMAGAVFTKYEDVQFSKAENISETREDIKRYLECELLIIDDLGTETTAAFVANGALYDIVNTRLVTNRKTIVNSNLTIYEMRERYSQQIMSRLEGEYLVLTFHGDDIRRKKSLT